MIPPLVMAWDDTGWKWQIALLAVLQPRTVDSLGAWGTTNERCLSGDCATSEADHQAPSFCFGPR